MEIGNKSAAGSFEGQTDSESKDKNTQEPPATMPQYSQCTKKHQVMKGQGSVVIHAGT